MSLPAFPHPCPRCHQPNYIPTIAHAPAVEKVPPRRGDPIPEAVDLSPKHCVHCGARTIPRFAVAPPAPPPPAQPEPASSATPSVPARGAPIPVAP